MLSTAQSVGISSAVITPDASSMLEIQATNKGLLIPRVALTATNAAGPITSPATSLMVYNNATAGTAPNNVTPGYYYWNGFIWVRFLGASEAWLTTGNNSLTETTNFLGNTDSIGVVFRTNNRERMRVDAHGRVGINISKYDDLNMLTVKGRPGYILSGTVSITNGTATITGSGTSFLTNLSTGDIIRITDGGTTNQYNVIDTVNNNTSATCLFSFSVTDAACQIIVYPSTFQATDYTEDASSTVIVDQIGDLGVGITYPFGFGRITSYESAQYGIGLYSWVTNADANGVYARNSAAANTGQNGDAVIGSTAQSGSGGGWFLNRHSSGTGVMAAGNNATTLFLTFGSGGAFTGTRVGAYGVQSDSLTPGSGYTQTYSGVYGKALFNRGTNRANYYHFGVGEFWNNSTTGNAGRSGGVLGYGETNASSCWGSLGYITSVYALAGVYGSVAYASGAGKSMDQPAMGFGVIGDGSLMGGLFHGDIYGLTAAGERYGMMVLGNTYTDKYFSVIAKSDEGDYVPLYAPVSEKVTIYNSGKAQVINGVARVTFSESFSSQVSENDNIIVTVTPLGPCNGLYVSESSANGFIVMENKNESDLSKINKPVEFNYIVIATRSGYETPSDPQELFTGDFYTNLRSFMTSERQVTPVTSGFWWDGSKIRYDEIPAGIMPQQTGLMDLKKQLKSEEDQMQIRAASKNKSAFHINLTE